MGKVWTGRRRDVGRGVGQTVTDSLALLLLLVPVGILHSGRISIRCLGVWGSHSLTAECGVSG